ncbi:hypothetical protein Tco_1108308 [Tanacetum coccineum]
MLQSSGYNVSKPLPWERETRPCKPFTPEFFFNNDLVYLRYGRKLCRQLLSIRKECKYELAAMYGILSIGGSTIKRFYIDRFYMKETAEQRRDSTQGQSLVSVDVILRIMSSITAQQTKLDLELVPKEKRLKIGKCNGRLNPRKKQREPTFQIVLDALALTPFRMDKKKKFDLNLEIFKDIFHICPKVHGQIFDEPPIDDVIVSLFIELDHTGDIKSITDVVVDQMHQPWRTFATIINRSLFGKTIGLDKLFLSRAQILWGMYYKKNVDYVELLWEYFTYQIDNKGYKKQEKIPEMRETKAYKTYLGYATGVTPLKKARKFVDPNLRSIKMIETKFTDKAEGDEDEEMDYTTSQLYDDVDIRLNELVDSDKGFVQEEGTDATMTNVQQGNENPEIVQVIEDAHVTLSTVPQKTEVLYSLPSSHNHYHPSLLQQNQSNSSPQNNYTEATNASITLLDFASVFQLNNIVTTLEKEIAELKKDPMYTQVTALVDDHLDARLGVTRDEFMSFLSTSLTSRITEQVQNQLPQILREESSQPQSLYEAAATLTKFKLKKILIDKIDKSESYLAAPEHRKCYEGLKKSYDLDKTILSTYGKVYSLKRSRKDNDKDPSTRSDRGLKKRKTSKDAAPATCPKAKES